METEGFVSTIGETGSNELKFYNAHDFSMMQRLELSQEGCVQLTTHSRSHFSIVMVTTGGSIFLWNSRPAKIIQPLAPFFTEIDENIGYVEKEDELYVFKKAHSLAYSMLVVVHMNLLAENPRAFSLPE
jgi:hypothetical protein